MWDRAYGGSTLVIHVEGATIPGAPILPECLKADVYLPPHLVDEVPECQFPIAAIVQTYIEDIGIPTVNRYIAAGRNFGWTFTQNQSTYTIPSSQNLPFIPPPAIPGSAHYVFVAVRMVPFLCNSSILTLPVTNNDMLAALLHHHLHFLSLLMGMFRMTQTLLNLPC